MNTAEYLEAKVQGWKKEGRSKEFIVWSAALVAVGWPYVYSAWGALCTPAERQKRYKLCPTHTTIKSKCKGFNSGVCSGCQWYPGDQHVRCFDCRGFTDYMLRLVDIDLYGDTCSAQWNHKENWSSKGTIDNMPKNRLCCLFVYKDGKWTHTGFGFGEETCECSTGVQHSATRNKKWTHWAVPAGLYDGTVQERDAEPEPIPATKEEVAKKMQTIRKGNKGITVRECQTILDELGYNLGICGVDGDFGVATEKAVKEFQRDHGLTQDGICGQKTWEALQKAAGSIQSIPAEEKYTVTIEGLTKEQAEKICKEWSGANMKKV